MFCTRCGFRLREEDLFCAKCGASVRGDYQPSPAGPILSRPMDQKKIAGVCAGFARYLDVDVTLMRVLWIALAVFTGGLIIIPYIAAAILMPKDYPPPRAANSPAQQYPL
jgi:phage shock protein C